MLNDHQEEIAHANSNNNESEESVSLEGVKSRASQRILNVNVGILGHVDSGKVSGGICFDFCHVDLHGPNDQIDFGTSLFRQGKYYFVLK